MSDMYPSKDEIENKVIANLRTLRDTFDQVERFHEWFERIGPAGFVQLGFEESQANELISAYTDLTALKAVAYGEHAQVEPNNFFFFAKKFWGLG